MTSLTNDTVLGGVELGGTTIRVVIAKGSPLNLVYSQVLQTGRPEETLPQALEILKKYNIASLGIGSFGPVDLNIHSPTYGYITSTPKPNWNNVDVVGVFKPLNVPIGFTTDVNSAALGELLYGEHGAHVNSSSYITVGTGIGAGLVVNNQCVEGLIHPEAGHIMVRKHKDDPYKGLCPFHGDCCEGLATARAIADRLGIHYNDLKDLPGNHIVWDIVGYYLAQLCLSITLIASPHNIILGGGVLKRTVLYGIVRRYLQQMLNGYLVHPKITEQIDTYIVGSRFDAPGSNTSAGIVGVLTLSEETLKRHKHSAL